MSRHMLLSSGEAITKSKRSPEKLFVLFDMYETLHDLNWRFGYQIQDVFCGEPAAGMEAAAGFIRWLAQTSKETFGDFEDAVEKDASKPPVFVEVLLYISLLGSMSKSSGLVSGNSRGISLNCRSKKGAVGWKFQKLHSDF